MVDVEVWALSRTLTLELVKLPSFSASDTDIVLKRRFGFANGFFYVKFDSFCYLTLSN